MQGAGGRCQQRLPSQVERNRTTDPAATASRPATRDCSDWRRRSVNRGADPGARALRPRVPRAPYRSPCHRGTVAVDGAECCGARRFRLGRRWRACSRPTSTSSSRAGGRSSTVTSSISARGKRTGARPGGREGESGGQQPLHRLDRASCPYLRFGARAGSLRRRLRQQTQSGGSQSDGRH